MSKNMCRVCFVDLKHESELDLMTLKNQTYAHVVGKHLDGFVINNAVGGSCNRRIIRTTVHDMIHQRQVNPEQQIIALIGLTFELRSEIWADNINERKTKIIYPRQSLWNFIFNRWRK